MPIINVIVPVYKVEPYLSRCVDSILNQSFDDFGLILVDDGSPDACPGICDEYAKKDSRVHVIHQENGGLSAARNAGIDWVFANSDSQWLTFIDSDDWVHRDYLKQMYFAARQHGAALAICGFLRTDRVVEDQPLPEQEIQVLEPEQAYIRHYVLCMHAWGKIIHRSLMEKIRFPVGKIYEDAFVTHLPLFACEKVVLTEAPMYYYFSSPGSITRSAWSPKHLERLEGHELRLSYLRENGLHAAYAEELRTYVEVCLEQTETLRLMGKKDKQFLGYIRLIRPRMMAAFREARGLGLYPYCRENVWAYELVYPVKPVWWLRNVLMRLVQCF